MCATARTNTQNKNTYKMMSTKNVKARNDMRYETASGGGINGRHASSKGGLFVLLSVVCVCFVVCVFVRGAVNYFSY